MKTRVI